MVVAVIWFEIDSGMVARVLAALIVADVLAVALQPLLARAGAPLTTARLRLTFADGTTREAEAHGADLGAVVATVIRAAEGAGGRVERLEVLGRDPGPGPGVRDPGGSAA